MKVARFLETLPFNIRKSKFYLKTRPFEYDLNHIPYTLTITRTPTCSCIKRQDLWGLAGPILGCLDIKVWIWCPRKGSKKRDIVLWWLIKRFKCCLFLLLKPLGSFLVLNPQSFPWIDLWLTDIGKHFHINPKWRHTLPHTHACLKSEQFHQTWYCPVRFISASACFHHLCLKSCLLLMMFLPYYVERQEWGNTLNEKKFKTYKQQIISHTNLAISETEIMYK